MRAQDQKLSRPPGPTRPARGRGLGERTLEGVVRRLQLQKSCPVKVQNVGNQKTHTPPVLCAFLAFETETSLAALTAQTIDNMRAFAGRLCVSFCKRTRKEEVRDIPKDCRIKITWHMFCNLMKCTVDSLASVVVRG